VERAGELLASALGAVLAEAGVARLAIPGGSALDAARVARMLLGREWGRVALTWVDERCVPVAEEASNRGAAARLGLLDAEAGRVDRPAPRRVLPLFEDGETPEAAVARVAAAIDSELGGALDVLLLGTGEDGHVASLFPSRPLPRQGSVAWVPDSPKPPRDRITLTPALLETAGRSVLLATGEAKRDALQRWLAGDVRLPLRGLAGLCIVTDLELGSTLRSRAESGGSA
jgi:6-phosphogluconolactonase